MKISFVVSIPSSSLRIYEPTHTYSVRMHTYRHLSTHPFLPPCLSLSVSLYVMYTLYVYISLPACLFRCLPLPLPRVRSMQTHPQTRPHPSIEHGWLPPAIQFSLLPVRTRALHQKAKPLGVLEPPSSNPSPAAPPSSEFLHAYACMPGRSG